MSKVETVLKRLEKVLKENHHTDIFAVMEGEIQAIRDEAKAKMIYEGKLVEYEIDLRDQDNRKVTGMKYGCFAVRHEGPSNWIVDHMRSGFKAGNFSNKTKAKAVAIELSNGANAATPDDKLAEAAHLHSGTDIGDWIRAVENEKVFISYDSYLKKIGKQRPVPEPIKGKKRKLTKKTR